MHQRERFRFGYCDIFREHQRCSQFDWCQSISGAGLPKITFVVSDAAGNVAYGRVVVIRMRVIRTVMKNSSSMYVRVFLL